MQRVDDLFFRRGRRHAGVVDHVVVDGLRSPIVFGAIATGAVSIVLCLEQFGAKMRRPHRVRAGRLKVAEEL